MAPRVPPAPPGPLATADAPAPSAWPMADLLWGVLIPPLLFWFDPCVFSTRLHSVLGFRDPIYGWWKAGAVLLAALGVGAMACALWVLRRGPRLRTPVRFPRALGVLDGVLYGTAVGALLIGVAVLPFALLGSLLLGLGLLGLVPFLTAWVLWRNHRLLRAAAGPAREDRAWVALGLGLVLALPAAGHFWLTRHLGAALRDLQSIEVATQEAAGRRLVFWSPFVLPTDLQACWIQSAPGASKDRVAQIFESVVGVPPEAYIAQHD